MDDLASKYLDFWEDLMQKALLSREVQDAYAELVTTTFETWQQGAHARGTDE